MTKTCKLCEGEHYTKGLCRKCYYKTPKQRAYQKKYLQSDKYKASQKKYLHSDKYKATIDKKQAKKDIKKFIAEPNIRYLTRMKISHEILGLELPEKWQNMEVKP